MSFPSAPFFSTASTGSSGSAEPAGLSRAALDDVLGAELESLRGRHLERTLRSVGRRHGALVETPSGIAIDFSSNDYLGLAADPRVAEAAVRALNEQGTGAAASRLISGNNPEHDALERDLAAYFDAEQALVFSSGYAANAGVIPALVDRGDVIFADALNHASLIDGCRLSRATTHVYSHADVGALRALMATHRAAHRRALVVTDGVFSMDGDRAPLDAVVALARDFDAWTYVDDAHAAGVLGEAGRGTASDAGLHGAVNVTLGTLGKAFGSAGAFVYGSRTLCMYLLNRARSFVFSTGMPPAQAAAARAALALSAAEPWRRDAVVARAAQLRTALHARDVATLGDAGAYIIPVLIGDDARVVAIGRALGDRGFLVGAVRPPTVPVGGARLRITVSAAHTEEHIDLLADAVRAALDECKTGTTCRAGSEGNKSNL